MSHSTNQLHICMLGSGNVGKSALTLQYMYDEFVEDYEPTKSDSYVKKINIDGVSVNVSILDTAGQESFAGVTDTIYRSGDGFIIVFSLTDMESFKAVGALLERFLIVRPSEYLPRILVGNKVDLTDERQVSRELALKTAQQWNIPYMETSAKNNADAQKIFYSVSKEIFVMKCANQQPQLEQNKSREDGCCTII
ncbi:unnamed protein product [Heterobilharzia americana]|nr:unnamed protein product [Heterobilharzia americana]CAH8573952.1 unnamed protein product [Heterobilharzia americana]